METRAAAPALHDVRGPSAFGGDLRRFRDLLWLLSVSEFRSQYAGTTLGFLWSIVRPLVFFGVIFLILREVLRFGGDIQDYGLILILSLILFTYFSDATSRAVHAASAKESIVRTTQFPRVVIPLSVSLAAAFTLVLNLIAVLPLAFVFGLRPQVEWLAFPALLLLLVILTTGICLLLAALFVRSPDTAQAWGLLLRMLFYASPVLFPIEKVPGSFQALVAANPLSPLLAQARVWGIDSAAPNGVDQVGLLAGLIIPAALGIALCVAGLWLFEREAPRVAERL